MVALEKSELLKIKTIMRMLFFVFWINSHISKIYKLIFFFLSPCLWPILKSEERMTTCHLAARMEVMVETTVAVTARLSIHSCADIADVRTFRFHLIRNLYKL